MNALKKLLYAIAFLLSCFFAHGDFHAAAEVHSEDVFISPESWIFESLKRFDRRGFMVLEGDILKSEKPVLRQDLAISFGRGIALIDAYKAAEGDMETLDKLFNEFQKDFERIGMDIDAMKRMIRKNHSITIPRDS